MDVEKRDFPVPSSDGIHTLAGVIYIPQGEIKGLFHIVHGMTEHIARYEEMMRYAAEEGFLTFGYDNLGHGYTANDDSELGFFAQKKGWDLLAKDVKVFSDEVKKQFGETLPYYLMGHSMGSFIVRVAVERYVRPDKLVIMGTADANPAADAGIALTDILKALYGPKHISALADKIAFGGYNSRFEGEEKAAPNPWLSTLPESRIRYAGDKFCTFKFTVSAMGDLIRLIKYSNRPQWYKSLPKDMPILLISGEDDPVGNYGKGIRSIEKKLKSNGINVKTLLYAKARHEILHDFVREEVKRDAVDFIKANN